MNLHEFLESKSRNSWIEFGPLDAYVRKAYHQVDGRYLKTFDVANVVVRDSKNRGRGTFKSFLIELKGTLLFEMPEGFVDAIYVENVQTERFREFFRRNGWTEISRLEPLGDPCFYIPTQWDNIQ